MPASLSGFVGSALFYLIKIAAPALVVVRLFIRVLARRPRERFTRRELAILVGRAQADAFSRIPLFRGSRDRVIGYVSHRVVLKAFARNADRRRKLASFLRPLPVLKETAPVGKALEQILQQREAIAIVSGQRDQFVGLIALEGLLEAIFGMQITDEAEAVTNLRPAVAESRRRRGVLLRRKRMQQNPPTDAG
jgi:Mg2+/Co2+ transporter CorC